MSRSTAKGEKTMKRTNEERTMEKNTDKRITCEICGSEIKSGPSLYTLFGQRACSVDCMSELSRRQAAETSKKLFGGK